MFFSLLFDTFIGLNMYSFTMSEFQRPPLEKLEIDLMSVFVINSLYWMLLCTHGQKPKDNELLQNEIVS